MKLLAAKTKTRLSILHFLDFASKPKIIQTPSTNLIWGKAAFYAPARCLNPRLASVSRLQQHRIPRATSMSATKTKVAGSDKAATCYQRASWIGPRQDASQSVVNEILPTTTAH
jgi:hypothetical protein